MVTPTTFQRQEIMELEKKPIELLPESTLKGSDQDRNIEAEEIEIVPDIHISNKIASASSEEDLLFLETDKTNAVKIEELQPVSAELIEIVPDLRTIIKSTSVNSQIAIVNDQEQSLQTFAKMIDSPNALSTDGCSDQDAEFRLACVNFMINYHANRHQQPSKISCQETEEQAASRRSQNAERMRNYRQNLRAHETEEQAVARRAQNALRVRNYRQFKREHPDLAAKYRAQNAFRMRMYRQKLRAVETDEQAATRRAENALRVKNYRKLKKELEPVIYQANNAQHMQDYRKNKDEAVTETGC